MKLIKLTRNQFAKVDDKDFAWLSKYRWNAQLTVSGYRARTKINRKNVYMSRLIVGLENGDKRNAEHKNLDTLDNTRSNLRIVSHGINVINRKPAINNRSGYRGIRFDKKLSRWVVVLRFELISDAIKFRKMYEENRLTLGTSNK